MGEDGILRTFIWGKQGGCWQDACELYGVENLILQTYDEPQWVHELLGILLEQKLGYIEENFPGMPFDLVETGGGASGNTVISPDIHEAGTKKEIEAEVPPQNLRYFSDAAKQIKY